MLDFGIRCVIAPSFADIFYNNCFKNGILPIALPKEIVDELMADAEQGANAVMTIDLESQTITRPDGEKVQFELDPFRKHCLLNGLDDIGLTEQKNVEIGAYEAKARLARPWQFGMTQRRGLSSGREPCRPTARCWCSRATASARRSCARCCGSSNSSTGAASPASTYREGMVGGAAYDAVRHAA